jgi:hypothetical protein
VGFDPGATVARTAEKIEVGRQRLAAVIDHYQVALEESRW